MLDYILIALLIFSGISLIIVEIIFVPGTTIVGVLGFAMAGYGIYHSYELFGADTGHIVFASTAVITSVTIFYSFKSNAWKRFAHTDINEGVVNQDLNEDLRVDQEGRTVSSLKPVGKAEFEDKEYEVSSLGDFVEENTPIKIIKILSNKIIIEPLK